MITVRNNTSQMIELVQEGSTQILLPDSDLEVSPAALDSGQLQYLAETGRVTIIRPASETTQAEARQAETESGSESARASKKRSPKTR